MEYLTQEQINAAVEAILSSGQADTVWDAEEVYLNGSYNAALALLATDLSNDELGNHPLMVLYGVHGEARHDRPLYRSTGEVGGSSHIAPGLPGVRASLRGPHEPTSQG